MKQLKLLLAGMLLSMTFLVAQAQRSITFQDVEKWQRITSRNISDDGKWVAAIFAPWRGDSRVELYSADGKEKKCYSPTGEYRFSSSSQYFLVKEVPALQLTDSLKLKKAKNMPMDKLTIRSLKSGSEWQIDSLVGYRLSESHDIIDYQRVHKDSALIIATLDGKETTRFKKIKSYSFAKKSPTLYISERRRNIRQDSVQTIKIYSSAKEAPVLTVNKEAVKVQQTAPCQYVSDPVIMRGKSIVEVKAGELSDQQTITIRNALRQH